MPQAVVAPPPGMQSVCRCCLITPGKLALRPGVDDGCSTHACGWAHAHVQGPVLGKAEAHQTSAGISEKHGHRAVNASKGLCMQ